MAEDSHSETAAESDRPAPCHRRPEGADDATVRAVGLVTEALETTERARGCLYGFHQLTGSADAKLMGAVEQLREAGHGELADGLERELVGRNVLAGRWTFQVVEEYEDGYWSHFRRWEKRVREELLKGRRHIHESEMKESERSTSGDGPLPGHAAVPESGT